jgi:hypothetical protein
MRLKNFYIMAIAIAPFFSTPIQAMLSEEVASHFCTRGKHTNNTAPALEATELRKSQAFETDLEESSPIFQVITNKIAEVKKFSETMKIHQIKFL